MQLDEIEDLFNGVADMDLGWWPFLFLRPKKHQRLTSARVALLSLLYGLPAGLICVIAERTRPDAHHPLIFPLCATLALFLFYRFSFAYFWNRRAARWLRRKSLLGDGALD